MAARGPSRSVERAGLSFAELRALARRRGLAVPQHATRARLEALLLAADDAAAAADADASDRKRSGVARSSSSSSSSSSQSGSRSGGRGRAAGGAESKGERRGAGARDQEDEGDEDAEGDGEDEEDEEDEDEDEDTRDDVIGGLPPALADLAAQYLTPGEERRVATEVGGDQRVARRAAARARACLPDGSLERCRALLRAEYARDFLAPARAELARAGVAPNPHFGRAWYMMTASQRLAYDSDLDARRAARAATAGQVMRPSADAALDGGEDEDDDERDGKDDDGDDDDAGREGEGKGERKASASAARPRFGQTAAFRACFNACVRAVAERLERYLPALAFDVSGPLLTLHAGAPRDDAAAAAAATAAAPAPAGAAEARRGLQLLLSRNVVGHFGFVASFPGWDGPQDAFEARDAYLTGALGLGPGGLRYAARGLSLDACAELLLRVTAVFAHTLAHRSSALYYEEEGAAAYGALGDVTALAATREARPGAGAARPLARAARAALLRRAVGLEADAIAATQALLGLPALEVRVLHRALAAPLEAALRARLPAHLRRRMVVWHAAA